MILSSVVVILHLNKWFWNPLLFLDS